MIEHNYLVVLVTVGSQEEGRVIAEALVAQRKAACVNIVPRVNSIFRWEGKLEDDQESLLVIKSRADLFQGIVDLVKGIHSYDVPEIIALPIIDGNREYLSWIGDETGAK